MQWFASRRSPTSIPIVALSRREYGSWLPRQPKAIQASLRSTSFTAEPGRFSLLFGRDGKIARVLVIVDDRTPMWSFAALPRAVPAGRYFVEGHLDEDRATAAALGWGLECYRFRNYKAEDRKPASLVWPDACDVAEVTRILDGIHLGRDLINTPANDMGPEELANAAHQLAKRHRARFRVVEGDALMKGYPAIHAVGKGSVRAPRLVDFHWGRESAPRVTLVGKGVCFDSGGLDLKTSGGMKLMKKDMGGAAAVLALAHMVMDSGLDVRLRVLIPAVENSISGSAYRPLDVLRTRKGCTVEIGNTDAEGRLVLCDALAEADAQRPDLLIDFATLTGAARVALGTDLPALFCNDDDLAAAVLAAATETADPLWRLPLYTPYRKLLDSEVADLSNCSDSGYAGAITAALFLQEFVTPETRWIHVDTMGWNLSATPGRPCGGEILGARAMYRAIRQRYG